MSIEEALLLFDDNRAEFVEALKNRLTSDEVILLLDTQIEDCGIDVHEIMSCLLKSVLKEDLIEWINDMGQFSWKPQEGL